MAGMVRHMNDVAKVFTLALECTNAVLFLASMAPTEANILREKHMIKAIMDELEGRSESLPC